MKNMEVILLINKMLENTRYIKNKSILTSTKFERWELTKIYNIV